MSIIRNILTFYCSLGFYLWNSLVSYYCGWFLLDPVFSCIDQSNIFLKYLIGFGSSETYQSQYLQIHLVVWGAKRMESMDTENKIEIRTRMLFVQILNLFLEFLCINIKWSSMSHSSFKKIWTSISYQN